MESKRPITASTPEKQKQLEETLKLFPTVNAYWQFLMFGAPKSQAAQSGCYSTGAVSVTKDFLTFASAEGEVQGLSAAFAYQLFHTYRNLLAADVLRPGDIFRVVEPGAGNGKLCLHILAVIESMAGRDTVDPAWKGLCRSIEYYIVEISPALIELQKQTTERYKKKVHIIEGNALDLPASLKRLSFAAVISNELLDMLPAHSVVFKEDGTIRVKQVLPFLPEEELKRIDISKYDHLKLQSDTNKKKLIACLQEIDYLKELSVSNDPDSPLSNQVLLSTENFQNLCAKNKDAKFHFVEISILTADTIPELKGFIKRNPEFFANMRPENIRLVETGISPFLKGVVALLVPGGMVLTVDYADHHALVQNYFTTYKDKEPGRDIYIDLLTQDITHHVNASLLEAEGRKQGLSCLFYGNQGELSLAAYPDEILSPQHKHNFEKLSRSSNFKVMVQINKPAGQDESKMAAISHFTERFLEKSQPVAYHELSEVKPRNYTIDSNGQLKMKFSQIEKLKFDYGVSELERVIDELQQAFAEGIKKGEKSVLVEGASCAMSALSEMIEEYKSRLAIVKKIQSKKLILESEKSIVLDANYFKSISFVRAYPTINELIEEKLKEITKQGWEYQPAPQSSAANAKVTVPAQNVEAIQQAIQPMHLTLKRKALKQAQCELTIENITLEKLYLPSTTQKPTSLSTKNMFTDPLSESICAKLYAHTEDLNPNLKWKYFPVSEKRSQAAAILISQDEQSITDIIAKLNTDYPDIKIKKMQTKENPIRYAVQLDVTQISRLTGIEIARPDSALNFPSTQLSA